LMLLCVIAFQHVLSISQYNLVKHEQNNLFTMFQQEESEWQQQIKSRILWVTAVFITVIFMGNQLLEFLGLALDIIWIKSLIKGFLFVLVIGLFIFHSLFVFTRFNNSHEVFELLNTNFPHGYIHEHSQHLHKYIHRQYVIDQIT